MRKVLLVTYHFPPSAASGTFRMLGFARYLPRYGWEPLVVAPPQTPWEPVDARLLEQVPPETVVYPAPYPQGRLSAFFRRIVPRAVWLPSAWAACRRAIRAHRPTALFTSSPPHWVHVLGLFLKRRYRLPWVADFRDPWVTGENPQARKSLEARWEARWEPDVLRGADRLLANAPLACEQFRAAFPQYADRIRTLTNGYDPDRFTAGPASRALNRPLRLLHTGELYAGRDPRPLLDALRTLQAEGFAARHPLRLCFLGRYSDLAFDFPALIREYGLEGVVELAPQVPYDEAVRRMQEADVLLLLDAPRRRVGVPAKLYEYLGAGRPVLGLAEPDGDTAWVLRESGISYRMARPDDLAAIRQALAELVGELNSGTVAAPAGHAVGRFSREYLAGELAQILDECAR